VALVEVKRRRRADFASFKAFADHEGGQFLSHSKEFKIEGVISLPIFFTPAVFKFRLPGHAEGVHKVFGPVVEFLFRDLVAVDDIDLKAVTFDF
jgi:hypothetical protein